jgi:glycosyltransferase involved in cell wall biosynthesis
MNIAFYFPTFNREKILTQSLQTAFNNTALKPNEAWIIDDGSTSNIKSSLLQFSKTNSDAFPINLLFHGSNYGIGYSFERIFNLINQNEDLDIACILESDYIWRKNWLEDVLAIFESCPNTLAIAGTDHPDMYDPSKTEMFVNLMTEQFDTDLKAREYLYKPFEVDTTQGKIKIQGVSNSCGCKIIHWKRLKSAIKDLEDKNIVSVNDFWKRMDRAFNKGQGKVARKYASDGHMSCTISRYGEMNLIANNIDITKNFPMVSICDYSISQHICGGGINGYIVPEGVTFINSPKWDNKFLTENPRTHE